MVWRLAPEQADRTEPCAICGKSNATYDQLAWFTDQVALHRHAEDGHALHRVYNAEAQRQARGQWTPYQRLHACHGCMLNHLSEVAGSEQARAAVDLLGMHRQTAVRWVIFHPEDASRQHEWLGAAPLGALEDECRQAMLTLMAEAPAVH
jgi:hypothetical protein